MPPDPWEITPEEVEERLAGKPQPLRGMLEAMWRSGPRMQLNARALADMPNAASLHSAAAAMTEDELREVLVSFLYEYYEATLSPEEYERWARPAID
jgi:hypothetical protein